MELLNIKDMKLQNRKELDELVAKELGKIKNNADLTPKQAKAETNRVIKTIDEERKNYTRDLDKAKKHIMEQVKEVLKPFYDYQEEMDAIVKAEKEKERQDKEQEFMALDGFSTWNKYFAVNEKWYNKGTSLESIQEEINNGIGQVKSNYKTIETVANTYDFDAEKYKAMLVSKDLDTVIERMKEDFELLQTKEIPKEEKPKVNTEGEIYTITRRIKGTYSQLVELKRYAKEIGVEWLDD